MDLEEKLVYLTVDESIATIWINRPKKRNALNYDMWLELTRLTKECEKNHEVKVVVYRGVDETAFSAGADISEFETLRYSAEGASQYNQAELGTEEAIMRLSKPSIALVQGFCVGGGCEIAIACDFRFSDEFGKYGITPARLGHIFDLPGTKNLVDLVGPAKAKDILFTARLLDAEEALRIGLVDQIYPSNRIVEETYDYAKLICKNAQFSVRGAKYIINRILEGETEVTEDVAQLVLDSFETEDYKHGVESFLAKRKPEFKYS